MGWNQPRGAGGALQGIWTDPLEGNRPNNTLPRPKSFLPMPLPQPLRDPEGAPGKVAAGTELPGTITVFILIKPHFHSN